MDISWFNKNYDQLDEESCTKIAEAFETAKKKLVSNNSITVKVVSQSGELTANTSDISRVGIDNATNLVMQKTLEQLKKDYLLNYNLSSDVILEIKDNRYNTYERIYTKIVPKIKYNIDDQGLKLYNEAVEYTIKNKD